MYTQSTHKYTFTNIYKCIYLHLMYTYIHMHTETYMYNVYKHIQTHHILYICLKSECIVCVDRRGERRRKEQVHEFNH